MISVSIRGNFNGVAATIAGIPKKLMRSKDEITNEFSKRVIKLARRDIQSTFPGGTGTAARSIAPIKLKSSQGESKISIEYTGEAASYGPYIERGFASHIIPTEYMDIHKDSPGTKAQYVFSPSGYIKVGEGITHPKKEFIKRAMLTTKKDIESITRNAVRKRLGK
jgi:hypothetical protein